jgi:hypothetical protein
MKYLPTSVFHNSWMFITVFLSILVPVASAADPNTGFENPDFEIGEVGQAPSGWGVPKILADEGFTAVLSATEPQSGKLCAEIRWPANPAGTTHPFANMSQAIDATPWRGRQIKVTAAIRVTSGMGGKRAQMWLRVNRTGGAIGSFDNMAHRPVVSQIWADYSILAEVAQDAEKITLGLMTYQGETAWWDNIRIEVLDRKQQPLDEKGLKNLMAFTHLLGYVRHFHPSDAAAAADWTRFICAALPKVEQAGDSAALAAELQAAFAPIAPTRQGTADPFRITAAAKYQLPESPLLGACRLSAGGCD